MAGNDLKILAIDTATNVCSVALIDGNTVAGESFLYGQRNHSEKLLSLVDALFENTLLSPER